MDAQPTTRRFVWSLYLVLSLWLAFQGVYRLLVPAYGLPAPSSTYWGMGSDAVVVLGFLIARLSVGNMAADDPRRNWLGFIFRLGLAGAIVIVAIRFMGDHPYWSGHLRYRLP